MKKEKTYLLYMGILIIQFYLFEVYAGFLNWESPTIKFYFSTIGWTSLLFIWIIELKEKTRFRVMLISDIVIILLMIFHLWYYRFFEDLISIHLLSFVGQVGDLGGSIKELVKWTDFLWFIGLYFIYLVYKKNKENSFDKKEPSNKWVFVVVSIISFVSILVPMYNKEENSLYIEYLSRPAMYQQLGFVGYHVVQIKDGIAEKFDKVTEEELEDIKTSLQKYNEEKIQQNQYTGKYKDYNVIYVQMESFESFVIDQKINGEEITPYINQLAKESLYFKNFYAQTGPGGTSDAELLANASIHPISYGSVYMQYPDNDYISLSSLLHDKGYDTAVFHGYKKSFWNRNMVYPNLGINHFYGQEDYHSKSKIGFGIGDKEFFQQSIEKMDKMEKPFMATYITLTNHYPFEMPKKHQKLNVEPFDNLLGDYLQSINYADRAVESFVKELKEKGYWENSIVVFYGDHTADFPFGKGEAEFFGIGSNEIEIKQRERRVPAIIHIPGEGKQMIEKVHGEIDIAPTVMNLLGIEQPITMMGQDMLNKEGSFVAFHNGSFIDEEYYYESDEFCYKRKEKKAVPISYCQKGIDEAAKRFNISETIIRHNLFEKLE